MSYTNSQKTLFKVFPLDKFGAEIAGIDLTKPFDADISHQLRKALTEFQVLVFRHQKISPNDQIRLTRCFGNLESGIARRPKNHQVPGHPDILYVSNKPDSPTLNYGFSWHSDGLAYARVPHDITLLYCIASPLEGGNTLFANQYMAYEAMPASLHKTLNDLFWHLPKMDYSEMPTGKGLIQPMVRTHSETKRKFLFYAPTACQLRGMTQNESAEILKVVHDYQIRDEFIYSHAWQENDIVIWENCTLLHNRADLVDFETQGLRAMHRSATSGRFEAIECEAADELDDSDFRI